MQKVLYTVKYLGIKIDKNLDYKHRINDIKVKSRSAYDLLFKCGSSKMSKSIYF